MFSAFKYQHMNVRSSVPYIFFILISFLSIQACNTKPADSKGTADDASSAPTNSWLVNLNEAYAQSVKDQKPILAYFTASDTCGLCKQLESDVFSTPVFQSWAEKKVVLLKIDIPSDKQVQPGNEDQNTAMARSLKVSTYPTFWVLSITHEAENGRFKVKPIGYTGYHPSTEKLLGVLQGFVRR